MQPAAREKMIRANAKAEPSLMLPRRNTCLVSSEGPRAPSSAYVSSPLVSAARTLATSSVGEKGLTM